MDDGKARASVMLELSFIIFCGIVLLGAFIACLTYDLVSALAPLCILVPLLILMGMQIKRTVSQALSKGLTSREFFEVLGGNSSKFNSTVKLVGWLLFLLGLIYVAGHYLAILLFQLLLLRKVAKESWTTTLLVSTVVTAIVYLLFSKVFTIELYPGLIPLWLQALSP